MSGDRVGSRLRPVLREDWEVHNRSWSKPGLHALSVHRLGVWSRSRSGPSRVLIGIVHRILHQAIRSLYGTDIHADATIGRRVRVAHHVGVVVGAHAVIGDDVILRQSVTLAGVDHTQGHADGHPTVGNGVQVGAGAVLAGPIVVGDGAVIGPGAVVLTDIPAGATALAPPARVMKRRTRSSTD